MKTPQEIARKWSRRLSGAREDMIAGAKSVDVSPGVSAAENIQRYSDGIQKALASGKTEAAMRAVPLQHWQQRYETKGVNNAIAAATDQTIIRKVETYQAEVAPTLAAIKSRIKDMKKSGASGQDRVIAAMQMMEEFGSSRRG